MLLARTTAAPQDRGPRPRTPRESSASTEHRQAYERAAIVVVPHRSPRRTGSAGNPRRVLPGHFDARWPWLDTAGAAQHQQTTRYGYGEQHGLEDSPLRVLTLPADPAPASRAHRKAWLHKDSAVSTSWALLHCTKTVVIVYGSVVV